MVQFPVPFASDLGLGLCAVFLLAAYVVSVVVRRRYFSSISDIPGPFLASISTLWEIWEIIAGHIEVTVIALHERHGKILVNMT